MSQSLFISCLRWGRSFSLAALTLGTMAAGHAEVQVVKEKAVPNRIRPGILVLPATWIGQIPPSGRVNAPEVMSTLYPGQKIALALIAEGPDRDKLLGEATVGVRITSPSNSTFERQNLKSAAIRRIKAEGADMALVALKAAGLGEKDREHMAQATSLVTLAIFQTDWTAPLVEQEEEIQISLTLSGNPPAVMLEPVRIRVRPTADWLNGPLPDRQEMGRYLNRYHEDMPPGRLLQLLKAVASDGGLKSPLISAFFALAYREDSAARRAAVALFPSLDQKTQFALLFVLRLGGQDLKGLPLALPDETGASLPTVQPLADPRNLPHFADPVTPEAVRGIGDIMDQCWSGWMATGDKSYLRALVGLLAGAPDFSGFQTWVKTKGGVKGLNASVARGLAYSIAGWSIGSFLRSDPHAADWLLYWENDPSFPAALRKEIAALPTNPAFRRD